MELPPRREFFFLREPSKPFQQAVGVQDGPAVAEFVHPHPARPYRRLAEWIIFGPFDHLTFVQAFIAQTAVVDQHNLVAAPSVEGENILQRKQVVDVLRLGLDLLPKFALDRFLAPFPKLDAAPQRPKELFPFQRVIPLHDEDPFPPPKQTDRQRTNLLFHIASICCISL